MSDTKAWRVWKPCYGKTEAGKRLLTKRWHVSIRHNGRTLAVSAFTDKQASDELGRKLAKLVALAAAGERPGPELARWIEREMPNAVRVKLTAWGVRSKRPCCSAWAMSQCGWCQNSCTPTR